MARPLVLLLALQTFTQSALSANILFINGIVASYSHRSGFEPLAEALAARGHNVSFYSPASSKNASTTIPTFYSKKLLSIHKQWWKEYGILGLLSRVNRRKAIDLARGFELFEFGLLSAEAFLSDEESKHFFSSNSFDLFVIDRVSMSDIFYTVAWKNNVKVISYDPLALFLPYEMYTAGVPIEAWMPVFDVPVETFKGSFMDRLRTEVAILSWYLSNEWYFLPRMNRILREGYQDPVMPSFEAMFHNHSIMLINQHYSDSYPKSLPPFVIPVGGMVTSPSDGKVPQEIEDFISSGTEGFVYISFGSIITISTLPGPLLQVFMDTIAMFPNLRFLWKWEDEAPRNAPKNILFRNWFPQNDVFAHPKIRGYIGQGGQVSLQEAIYHGVPAILFPVNGDQDWNALRSIMAGNGVSLEFCGLTVEELTDAIHRVTSEESFQSAAKKLSNASKNRPISALDTAVWWTEFVLSQEDLSYLKPPVEKMPWWVQRQLDVFAVMGLSLVTVILMFLSFFFYCMRKLLAKVLSSGVKKTGRKSKKKTL